MRFARDRRPPIEQVTSGLRIVGAAIASVAAVALFGLAYVQIANVDRAHNPLAGWLLIVALTATLVLTVQYWRRWFFFIPGYLALRSSLWLLLGWFSPKGFVFIGFAVLLFVMSGMSFRFRESNKLGGVDRAVLLLTAACLFAAMLQFFSQGQSAMSMLYAAIGDLALTASRFFPTRKSRQRPGHDSEPLVHHR
jgi:hypothetical protein